jgi:hypothetical protein
MSPTLDVAIAERRAGGEWRLPGLGATGPVPQLERKLQLFGQFVGDWDIFSGRSETASSTPRVRIGEVHFGWILGGTAIQDVWGSLEPKSKRLVPQGTTLRLYDSTIGAWRVTWISPYQRAIRRFIGEKVGSQIILKEQERGWRGEHWIFSNITHSAFRWRAEARPSIRGPRQVTEEYLVVRTRSKSARGSPKKH